MNHRGVNNQKAGKEMYPNKKSFLCLLVEIFFKPTIFLEKFLNSKNYVRYSIIFILIITSITWIDLARPFYSKESFLFFVSMYIGILICGYISLYLLYSLTVLFITYVFLKKRLIFKKLLGGIIICSIPNLILLILNLIVKIFYVGGISTRINRDLYINFLSLAYIFNKSIENTYLLSIFNLINPFEIWRIFLISLLLNILGKIKLIHGIIIAFCIDLSFVFVKFLLIKSVTFVN